jgi:hypothetical protein
MESSSPAFWQDQERAQIVMRRLGELKGQVDRWKGLEKKTNDLLGLPSSLLKKMRTHCRRI